MHPREVIHSDTVGGSHAHYYRRALSEGAISPKQHNPDVIIAVL